MALKKDWNKDIITAITVKVLTRNARFIKDEAKILGLSQGKALDFIINEYRDKKYKLRKLKPIEDPLTLY